MGNKFADLLADMGNKSVDLTSGHGQQIKQKDAML
jgi:hypothetical protein